MIFWGSMIIDSRFNSKLAKEFVVYLQKRMNQEETLFGVKWNKNGMHINATIQLIQSPPPFNVWIHRIMNGKKYLHNHYLSNALNL